MAVGADPAVWWTALGPIVMAVRVSGKGLPEPDIAQPRPGCADDVRRTSRVLPRPRRVTGRAPSHRERRTSGTHADAPPGRLPAMAITDEDLGHLRRCVELAQEALEAGDSPFGSVLVAEDGTVLQEDRNRERTGDPTHHPEVALARWAAQHLDPAARAAATVYTSGEHCPMCSGAHAVAGLGRIVFAAGTPDFAAWRREHGGSEPRFALLPITTVAPGVPVDGPAPEIRPAVGELYARYLSA